MVCITTLLIIEMIIKNQKKFIEDLYITCDQCGYNNLKDRFQAFGTCLHCGKVLDKKVYFKSQLIKKSIRKARIEGRKVSSRHLIF